ncbi:glycosyltransferase family 2 protein [Micropruina glycogenica]|uniref:glycosyltransferase family 2 protein n=1 Tax=Micropruina glycogenica TaxID=75385 RepID=UPI00131A296F|nr:glycosyltransferase family 2 protein [Micropruina glycogenica]
MVVVLSYKGADDTMACVESLVVGSPSIEVLVVDNGSGDGLLERVGAAWPQVHTLQTGANLGYSGGMNAGIRWALNGNARTVTVLNNDTVIPSGVLERLVEKVTSGLVVSPEVRYADRPDDVWFGGGAIDADTALPRHLQDVELRARGGAGPLSDSPILAGCCLTATAEVWRRVGLFDDRFFLMFEDSEWSERAQRAGVRLVVDHTTHIRHKVSASFKGPFAYLGLYYYARNGLLFGSIHSPWKPLARLRFLRRHVLIVPVAAARRGDIPGALQFSLVIVLGVAARLLGAYGRAPGFLERLSLRWSDRAGSRTVTVNPVVG